MSEEILCHLPVSTYTFVIFQIWYLQMGVSIIWKMLSFDQYHSTFHNLTEQRYVGNYFSGDGAKEGISPFTRVISRLKTGVCSAIISDIGWHQYFKRNSVTSCFPENIWTSRQRISWLRQCVGEKLNLLLLKPWPGRLVFWQEYLDS